MNFTLSRKRCAEGPLYTDSPAKLPRVSSFLDLDKVRATVAAVLAPASPTLPCHYKQTMPEPTEPRSEPEETRPEESPRPLPPRVRRIGAPAQPHTPIPHKPKYTPRQVPTRPNSVTAVPDSDSQTPPGSRRIIQASRWHPLKSSDSSSVASSSRVTLDDSTASSISNDSSTDRPSSATSVTSAWSNDTPQPTSSQQKEKYSEDLHGPRNFLATYTPKQSLDSAHLAYTPDSKPKPRPSSRKKRLHIFDREHRASLALRKEEMRVDINRNFEVMRKQFARSAERKGLTPEQYSEYTAYAEKASKAIFDKPEDQEEGITNWFSTTFDKPKDKKPEKEEFSEWFSLAFPPIRDSVLNAPKPSLPYTPTIEEAQRIIRSKDALIESRLRPPRPTLPSKLPPADENYVEETFRKRGTIAKVAREQVGDQDIRRLRPAQWLNDEIINFYGAMINARAEGQKENGSGRGKVLKAFYLSTFFWHKLVTDGYEKGRLAKWTKKVDIFSQDVVLIPVNHHNAHWTAGAINFQKKRFESYDSMGMAKEVVWRKLREYVHAEHQNKKKKPFNFDGWENWAPDSTPQQENGFDCGVFTCQFLESLSRGEDDFIFTQKDMPYLRRRMVWEIGHARLRSDV